MPFLALIRIVPSWCYWLLALVALCIACEVHGRHEVEKKYLKKEADAALQLSEAAREQERIISHSLSAISDNHHKESKNAKVKIDSLVNDVRSGKQRLSVAINSCSTAGDSTATAGTVTEARAELLPKTAIDLIELAAGADAEVRRTNECIDSYNAVRNELNGASIKN